MGEDPEQPQSPPLILRDERDPTLQQNNPLPPSAPAGKETKKETKKEAAPKKVKFLRKVPAAGGDLLVNVVTPSPWYLRGPD